MNQSENSPRFDISTILPVGVGMISLFGICLLLMANRLAAPRAIVEVPNTATPFRYLFLGTEPGIASTVPEEIGTRTVGFSITAQSGFSGADGDSVSADSTRPAPTIRITRTATESATVLTSPTATFPAPFPTRSVTAIGSGLTNTPITLPTLSSGATVTSAPVVTRTLTPTSISAAPMEANTYDDTDSHLIYTGDWISQTGQSGAALGTLHVSSTLNNTVTFRFFGDQLRIVYQSGASLGTMTASIDGTTFPPLNQSGSPSTRSEWAVTGLTPTTHHVILTHSSGGSINLDEIIVPSITLTSTPTATATNTPPP